VALPGAAEIAAKAKAKTSTSTSTSTAATTSTSTSEPIDAPPKAVDSINVAKEIAKQHPSIDHLSAPASRIQSGTATPAPEAEPTKKASTSAAAAESTPSTAAATKKEEEPVKEAATKEEPAEQAKQPSMEEVTPAAKKDDDDAETETAAKGVEGVHVGEGAETQKQDAKEGEDAGKSLED
jgi:hypothetical protein